MSFNRTVVQCALIGAFLVLLSGLQAAVAETRNVLLIVADDQGRDLGVYGNPVLRTPNLDALAARGTLFTNAFATVSSCSPSRSVIYTGLYSHSNGMYGLAHDVHNQHLLPTVQTLPQYLKAAGYRTGLVGKKHILPESALPFDEELAPERPGNRDVAFMAGEARKFISRSAGKPFLLIVGYSDPHRAPENFGNTQTWPQVARATYDPAKVIVPAHLPDLPEVRRDLAQYYESVSRLDSGVGLLLDVLRDTKHEGDTLVVYLSDNGRAFPGAKTTLYDEGIHLPLIVWSPKQQKHGVRNDAMVSWIDILPTVLDWTGVPAPSTQQLPGRSILPILEQSHPPGWERVFASHGFHEIQQYYPMRALRTREHKYIVNLAAPLEFPIAGDIASSPTWRAIVARPSVGLGARSMQAFLHRPTEELYDLRKDPAEVNNLAGDAAHRAVLERMRAELQKFRVDTHDPWLPGQAAVFGHEENH
jgi:N-sulfoglucosamine sulfohydrolase